VDFLSARELAIAMGKVFQEPTVCLGVSRRKKNDARSVLETTSVLLDALLFDVLIIARIPCNEQILAAIVRDRV